MIENQFGEFFPPTLDSSGNSYNSEFTTRDHFAGLAMQGMLSDISSYEITDIHEMAYHFADAMMKERAK